MKALKGVLTYVGIVLLAIIVIAALTIGMMFFTKGSVFGYYFLQFHKDGQLLEFHMNDQKLNTYDVETLAPGAEEMELNINTDRYSVRIVPHNLKVISFVTDNHYIGFLQGRKVDGKLKAVTMPTISVNKKDNDSKKLLIDLHEPQGALSISKISRLIVFVPYEISGKCIKYNVNVNTGNGNIDITNSFDENGRVEFPVNINSLDVSTKRGNVTIKGVGDNNGIKENLTLDKLNIKTQGGTFDFTAFKKVSVKSKVRLESNKATYKFNELESYISTLSGVTGGVEITGNNVKFTADRVTCGSDGFIYKAETGALNINKLISGTVTEMSKQVDKLDGEGKVIKDSQGNAVQVTVFKHTKIDTPYENTIFANSSEINLGVVVGKLGLYSEYGNVNIGVLSNQASMQTENGNIYIGTSGTLLNEYDKGEAWENNKSFSDTSSLILYSTYGDITVNEYYQDAVIYSKKGKIYANSRFHTTKDVNNDKRYYYSNISSKDGQIIAITEGNPMMIDSTDSSTIQFYVKALKSSNSLKPAVFNEHMYKATSKNGRVVAEFPMSTFIIKVQAKTIAGSIGSTSEFGDYDVTINPDATATTPKVYISARRVELSSSI